MNYPLTIPGFEGQKLEVKTAGIFSGPKLLVNGHPAPKGEKRNQLLLRHDNGQNVVASWKSQFIDVPKLVVDGVVIDVVEPLRWYQWVWSGLPLLLIVTGGALGGLFGVIGMTINAKVFRSGMNIYLRFGLTAIVTILTAIGYLVSAVLFIGLINGVAG